MDSPVLIDTSIWIDYFRKEPRAHEEVERLIDASRVRVARMIVAELIQGAKTDREIAVVTQLPDLFAVLHESATTWERAGHVSHRLKRQGKTVGLGDCYLAALAEEHAAALYTKDKDFQVIKTVIDLVLFA